MEARKLDPIVDLMLNLTKTLGADGLTDEQRAATKKQDEFVHEGHKYLLSTISTWDNGPETMLFSVCKDGSVNYLDLYAKRHGSMEEGYVHHNGLLRDIPALMERCYHAHADVRREQETQEESSGDGLASE